MVKKFSWAGLMSPLLIASLLSPQMAFAQASKGNAGTTSGNNGTAGSNTTFSVPVTITAPGAGGFTPVSGNLTVTPGAAGQPATVTAPPAITQAVAQAGVNVVITFSTGTLSQQQIATLVSSVASVVSSLQGNVPETVIVSISTLQGNNVVGQPDTFPTLAQAFQALSTGLAANVPNGAFSLQVGNVKVTISPRQ